MARPRNTRRRCQGTKKPPCPTRHFPKHITPPSKKESLSSHVATFFFVLVEAGPPLVGGILVHWDGMCLDIITRHCPPLLPLIQPGSITFPPIWIQTRAIYITRLSKHRPSQWRGHNSRRRVYSSKKDIAMSGKPTSLASCPAHKRVGPVHSPTFFHQPPPALVGSPLRRVIRPFLRCAALVAVVTTEKALLVHRLRSIAGVCCQSCIISPQLDIKSGKCAKLRRKKD